MRFLATCCLTATMCNSVHLHQQIDHAHEVRMTFTRIRNINGHQYLYEEHRWREAGRVKSRSRSLGPIDGGGERKAKRRSSGGLLAFMHAQRLSAEDRAFVAAEKEAARIEQYQREIFGETAPERAQRERQEHLDKLHAAYGLRLGPPNPTPIEPRPAPTVTETKEDPAEAGSGVAPSEGLE